MTAWILAGCALALTVAFSAMAWLGDLYVGARSFVVLFGLASAAYGLAVARVVWRPPGGSRMLLGIVGAALVFRVVLLPTTPSLSTDLYRYLWDGRLAVAGVSPYRHAPGASELAGFRDEGIYPRLNHRDWRTIYPPGAQILFAGMAWLAPGSALALKLLIGLFDVATIGLLVGWLRALGRPPTWVLVYAWHPLVVVELAGSGHLDAVVLAVSVAALWAATREQEGWAGALVGVGTVVKLYPVLLLAAVCRRRSGRALAGWAAVVAAGYALYAHEGWAVLGSLGRYVAEEEFNGSLRTILDLALAPFGPGGLRVGRVLPLVGLALAALGIALAAREVPPWRRAVWLVGGYLLAVPNLFPWYTLWIVPLLAAAPAWPWLYLSSAVALTYLVFVQAAWGIPGWVTAVEFVPFAAGLVITAWPRAAGSGYLGARDAMGASS